MPKRGQNLRTIQRIEDASAFAITARDYLAQLELVLTTLQKRGGIDPYNYMVATKDIATTRAVIDHLQAELCQFRSNDKR